MKIDSKTIEQLRAALSRSTVVAEVTLNSVNSCGCSGGCDDSCGGTCKWGCERWSR